MANLVATTEDMTTVADAIRIKGGTSAPLSFPDEFASAIQAIPVPKPEQEKELTITENGDYPITPDVGKVLSKAIAHVNVPTGGGGGGFDPSPFSRIVCKTWTPAAETHEYVVADDPGNLLFADFYFMRFSGPGNGLLRLSTMLSDKPGGVQYTAEQKNLGKPPATDRPIMGAPASGYGYNPTTGVLTSSYNFSPKFTYAVLLAYGPLK